MSKQEQTQEAQEQEQGQETRQPGISTRAVRGLLLPLASFYSRASVKPKGDDGQSVDLEDSEKEVMADAASKFIAETQGVLRAWRVSGDTRPDRELLRDPKTGLWPEPSVSFVGEVMAAFGVVDQESAQMRRELEIARMETELEKERMSLERARLEFMSARIRSGQVIDDSELKVISAPVVVPPTLQRLSSQGQPATYSGEVQTKKLAISAPVPQQTEEVQAYQSRKQAYSDEKGEEALESKPENATWARVKDCVRVAFCDLVWCVLGLVCVDGKFNRAVFDDERIMDQLADCLMEFVCSLLRCIAVALCPPETPTCLPETANCDFAVEEVS